MTLKSAVVVGLMLDAPCWYADGSVCGTVFMMTFLSLLSNLLFVGNCVLQRQERNCRPSSPRRAICSDLRESWRQIFTWFEKMSHATVLKQGVRVVLQLLLRPFISYSHISLAPIIHRLQARPPPSAEVGGRSLLSVFISSWPLTK